MSKHALHMSTRDAPPDISCMTRHTAQLPPTTSLFLPQLSQWPDPSSWLLAPQKPSGSLSPPRGLDVEHIAIAKAAQAHSPAVEHLQAATWPIAGRPLGAHDAEDWRQSHCVVLGWREALGGQLDGLELPGNQGWQHNPCPASLICPAPLRGTDDDFGW